MHIVKFYTSLIVVIIAAGMLAGCFSRAVCSPVQTKWSDRVIPLPKQLRVDDVVAALPTDVAVAWPDLPSPCVATMRALLSSWAMGELATARVVIVPELVNWEDDNLPTTTRQLRIVPNQNQSYAIIHEGAGGKHRFRLLATTPQGLLYAARTLTDLAHPTWRNGAAVPPHKPATDLELPMATIVDWPDLADRGTHAAGNPEYNLDWLAQWKLNYLGNAKILHAFDLRGNPQANGGLPPVMLTNTNEMQMLMAYAAGLGVNVEMQIAHIGDGQLQLIREVKGAMANPKYAFIEKIIFARDGSNKVEKAVGLCMSNPNTIRLLADIIALNKTLTSDKTVTECVWLSEAANLACFCDKCRGRNGYLMEALGIYQAWQLAGGKEAGLQLKILNSQGSFDVNEEILRMLPDVGLVHYDGFASYSTDHKAIIPDYITAAAKNGRYVMAVIQPEPSFFAVFPGSIPQFLRFRAAEFHGKGLSGVTTWLVPDRQLFEINMAALAEWSWNANGRSVEDFARAFATITGMPKPALYAKWIEHAGEAAWWLAESRFIESLLYSLDNMLNNRLEEYPKGSSQLRRNNVYQIPQFDRVIEHARRAMALADRSGDIMMRCESACVLAALYAYDLAEDIRVEHARGTPAEKLRVKFDRLELYARQIRAYHNAWFEAAVSRRAALPKNKLHPMFGNDFDEGFKPQRVSMPEHVLFRACDVWREKLALPPSPLAGQWQWGFADFGTNDQAALSFDVTPSLSDKMGGLCVIMERVRSVNIHHNRDIQNHQSTRLMVSNTVSGVTRIVDNYEIVRYLRFDLENKLVELTFTAPKLAKDERLFLKVNLSLHKSDRPASYNPLTDGVNVQEQGKFVDVTGRITVRPVDLLDAQLQTTGWSQIEPWR